MIRADGCILLLFIRYEISGRCSIFSSWQDRSFAAQWLNFLVANETRTSRNIQDSASRKGKISWQQRSIPRNAYLGHKRDGDDLRYYNSPRRNRLEGEQVSGESTEPKMLCQRSATSVR